MNALEESAPRFGVSLRAGDVSRLRDYFRLVAKWNARLHLVAPCTPTEFATRHVLESLLALAHMPVGSMVVDVGSGAGLPIIPCLIARPDLRAVLIESSKKKAVFLREAFGRLELPERADVIAERFERVEPPVADVLTCRALERFTEMLPKIVEWSSNIRTLLLFGGLSLKEQLERAGLSFQIVHIPKSERRYLFIIKRCVQKIAG